MLDLVGTLLGGGPADLGIGPGSQPLREITTDVELHLGVRELQLLHVGVDRDELHLIDAGVDHPVHGVESGAADADDLDLREVRAELTRTRVVQAGRRFRHRLDVTRDGWLGNGRRRRHRLRCRRNLDNGLRRRNGARRRRRLQLILPARDVLDRRLVRLLGRRRLLLLGLALRCLGCLEELGERALTHARALSRH